MNKLTQHSIRISVAVTMGVMLIAFGAGKALAYTCGAHCHGVNEWAITAGEYYGASTDISMAHLTCDPTLCASSEFITNEMWLVNPTNCPNQNNGLCWVEAGYIDSPPPDPNNPNQSTNQSYFWADDRPGSSFMFELFQDVPTNEFGNTDHFVIINDNSTTPGGFQILVYNNSSTTLLQGISNDNTMIPTEITIGQELVGSAGASAPRVTFTHNMFAVQALGPSNMFVYNTQTAEGTVLSDGPPFGQWNTDPATSPDGGQFSTSCC
nr:hypothetical protein [Ktedonobacteraceae bacterium]